MKNNNIFRDLQQKDTESPGLEWKGGAGGCRQEVTGMISRGQVQEEGGKERGREEGKEGGREAPCKKLGKPGRGMGLSSHIPFLGLSFLPVEGTGWG